MNDLQFPGLCIGPAADPRPTLPLLCRSGFYALVLAEVSPESGTKYGRRHYDYCDGTLICHAPGAPNAELPAACLWTVAFHPDLFRNTVGERGFAEYTFFSYTPEEALHLSAEERRTLTSCIDDIRRELLRGEDRYTRLILIRHTTRLLDYTTRFYERQFITRNPANESLVRTYEAAVERYLADGRWATQGPLAAPCCAKWLGLSEAYFEDLLRQELGHTHHCYMQLRRIEIAKRKLCSSKEPLSLIAHDLGFPSVQYFSSLFRKLTGLPPAEYRALN